MSKAEQYIEELKNGKQIRVKYNKNYFDGNSDEGWLWFYNDKLNLFICHHPKSSYEKDYCTVHLEKEFENYIINVVRDYNNEHILVLNIIIEENSIPESSLSLKELAVKRINNMTEDELRFLLVNYGVKNEDMCNRS